MKKFSILALVLAFTMMLSVVSFAADATYSFKTDGAATNAENTEVKTADNTDSFTVSTATADGNYYGILLVKGDDLPVVDNAILYIDQLTADATTEDFIVKPIVPEVGEKLTLYISSNAADAKLISIPMVYSSDVVTPAYTRGDVNDDGSINLVDVLTVLDHYLEVTPLTGDALLAADVNVDGSANLVDVLAILDHYLEVTPLQ